jgi:hypothetical protein
MNGPGVMMRYNSPMDGMYRLVFRGEILDGQHRAVVKRRLKELLNLSDSQVETLFAEGPVVIKRNVDEATAKKYQVLFKKAGGRLRAVPAAERAGAVVVPATAAATTSETMSETSSKTTSETTAETAHETAAADASEGLSLQSYGFTPPASEPVAELEAPDFAVAELGAVLAEQRSEVRPVVRDVDFEVAEVGADMLTEPVAEVQVRVTDVDFDLAEVGADIGDRQEQAIPPPPDISHLGLVEE